MGFEILVRLVLVDSRNLGKGNKIQLDKWGNEYGLLLFSCSVVSNSLWSHGMQHTRPPCPSPTPGAYSDSCPPSWWCHPTISSSVVPFSSCPQSFPASGSFPMSLLLISGGHITGASTSTSVLLMNIQGLFPLGLTGLILPSKGPSRGFSSTKGINSNEYG